MSNKTLAQEEDHELSILPAIPREAVNNTTHLETEQDVKASLSTHPVPTLSRRPTNGSGVTSTSFSSRNLGSSVNAPIVPHAPTGIRKVGFVLVRHLKFVGPGLVSSVAYFDP
jgi:hypothetical protein